MNSTQYKTLANKYRPTSFKDLVGQEVLVRTLNNAIKTGRIANAYVLTGIRGVGKTTTARIIARGFNCIGEDGNGGSTIDPCGKCANCISILQDRNVDVIEFDAASNTSVDDARDIIENSRYLPISARYKIYIIDEVHMLSKNAFNALLKTLEEPPKHVKFIFATTEIRKIPVTVLSRCQRFDLKRIQTEELANHLQNICIKENVKVDYDALQIIANIAEGSVRDSLSLLDQALIQAEGNINADLIRKMLGLADFTHIVNLFALVAGAKVEEVLNLLNSLYIAGSDEIKIINELLDFVNLVTKIKLVSDANLYISYPEYVIAKAKEFAYQLNVSFLTRCWQMLLKGLGEIKESPNGMQALEMVLIRIMYMSNLPSPSEVIEQLTNKSGDIGNKVTNINTGNFGNNDNSFGKNINNSNLVTNQPNLVINQPNLVTSSSNIEPSLNNFITSQTHKPNNILEEASNKNTINNFIEIIDFRHLVDLFKQRGEILLHSWLLNEVNLIKFSNFELELNPSPSLPSDFITKISHFLQQWTGKKWQININKSMTGKSLAEENKEEEEKNLDKIAQSFPVKQILEAFPGSKIIQVNETI